MSQLVKDEIKKANETKNTQIFFKWFIFDSHYPIPIFKNHRD